jgi:CPA1 family monovalent cation:H+ antiporter
MTVFELVLLLLLGGVVLSLLAPRLGVPWPALLAVGGAGLAFVPGMPPVQLEPDLALALFVAPILLDAGYDTSPRDLRANWVPIGSLVLVAVGLTVACVAAVAHGLAPQMPWAAAVALGAIVAPPDAAAATSVLRQVRLPHRMMVVLEGESLLNDASALLIYRVAVGAVAGGLGVWTAPSLVVAVVGGVALGYGLARLYLLAVARLEAGPASVVLQFLSTFGVWLLAEAMGLSAVLTMVAYAVTLARTVHGRTGARQRRYAYAVWEVAIFVLNVLAFVLIGLQLRGILGRLDGGVWQAAGFAAAVLAVTILARLAWVLAYGAVTRRMLRHRRTAQPLPTVQGSVVVAWCGMRGIVTLAAALALPEGFPYRDLIVFTAFCVVLGTLVLQGMTLQPLLARVTMAPDDSVAQELALARRESAIAVLAELRDAFGTEAGHVLQQDYKARLKPGHAASAMAGLRRRALAIERATVLGMLRDGRIGDDAYHQLEEVLDWAEAEADPLQPDPPNLV